LHSIGMPLFKNIYSNTYLIEDSGALAQIIQAAELRSFLGLWFVLLIRSSFIY
jgi:hypothetical protein